MASLNAFVSFVPQRAWPCDRKALESSANVHSFRQSRATTLTRLGKIKGRCRHFRLDPAARPDLADRMPMQMMRFGEHREFALRKRRTFHVFNVHDTQIDRH